jgi:hypothetical protein
MVAVVVHAGVGELVGGDGVDIQTRERSRRSGWVVT